MADDIFPTDQLTDVATPADFWGDGAAYGGSADVPFNPGNAEDPQNHDTASLMMPTSPDAENPANHDKMTQPLEANWGQTALSGVKAGLKSLGSPAAKSAVNENAALYRYYGDKATAAYQPSKMGTSSPAAAGQMTANKGTDANSLNSYWLGKLKQFSVPGWNGK